MLGYRPHIGRLKSLTIKILIALLLDLYCRSVKQFVRAVILLELLSGI